MSSESSSTKPVQKRPNMLVRSALLLLVAVFVITVCVTLVLRRQQSSVGYKRTAAAKGHVIDVYSRGASGMGTTADTEDVIIDFEYEVGGRNFRNNVKLSGKTGRLYQKGQDATVCYDPAHPSDAEIYASEYSCSE